jgi:hypothetical protein
MAHVEELRQIHADINAMETIIKQAEESRRAAQVNKIILVGFCRACTSVNCVLPSFYSHKQEKRGTSLIISAISIICRGSQFGKKSAKVPCTLIVQYMYRPKASRLRPDYLADFLHEKIWRTFYNEVLPDFLAYYFPRFHVQKNILSYLNITNWPIVQ